MNKKLTSAATVQVLIQNYLYDKYNKKETHVYLYDEIINDIDIFNKPLELDNTNIIIDAFLSYLDTNDIDYNETIDVKFANDLLLKNIKQILRKCIYPNHTNIKLIFIPSIRYEYKEELTSIITTFNKLKYIIFNKLTHEQRKRLANNLLNITNYDNCNINDGLFIFVDKLLTHKDTTDFKHNATNEDINTFINNLNNFSIEVIEKDELLKVPIHRELLETIIGCEIGYKQVNLNERINKIISGD